MEGYLSTTTLSNRTLKILFRNDINTVDKLLAFASSRKFFSSSVRGLGRKGNSEIINFVKELQGKETEKQHKFERLIKEKDLEELERSLKSNIEKYGIEEVANLCSSYISRSNY
jgi:hypothetical protein